VSDVEATLRLIADADLARPLAVRTVSALGLADTLAAGACRVDDLAAGMGTDAAALRRVLRALAPSGVVREVERDRFELGPAGEPLRTDHPLSMRDAYGLSALEVDAWTAFEHSLRTGAAAFEHVHGQGHRAYRAAHPEEDVRMDRAHRAATRLDVLTLARVYAWADVRTIVDVGGGTGALLAGLLQRFGHLSGILLDLPRMVAGAPEVLAAAGVADRCRIVGGDFFERLPAGADVYVLKAVVGGWDDASVMTILRTVRAAMRRTSRLLVIEPISEAGGEFTIGNVVHLQSLVLYGGPDRTREEFARLLGQAGLALARVIPRATLPVMEALPIGVSLGRRPRTSATTAGA
jgi:O-methyltransferase domain